MSLGPIFIVGMNGSGTTMLLDHLNNHPLVYGFREESRILPHFLAAADRRSQPPVGKRLERLWVDMCGAFPFWKVNKKSPVPVPADWKDRDGNPAAIFSYIMQYFADLEGKQIWCEKTPMHAVHIKRLSKEFPGARFIHTIRDGRDCAASFHRRWGYDPRTTIFRWKKVVRAARGQGAELSNRYLEVFFEELTTEPEKSLRRICEFLDLSYDDRLRVSSRGAARVRALESAQMVPNSGRYQSHFSASQVLQLEQIAGSLLRELGYATDQADGDRDLSALYVRWHQAKVKLRLGLATIENIVRKRAQSPLRTILGRYISSWRQRKTTRY